MVDLPCELIKSLTKLGLLESEAKLYSALVFLQSAEVRDLVEFLDVSKPSVYEGLKTLEEYGLIVLTSPRPATYQAIEPEIALELIMKRYRDAKKEALIQLQDFKNQEISTKPSSPMWFIFGAKSFEFKIKQMLKNAKGSIYCSTSIKYLSFIEKAAKKNIQIYLVVIEDDEENNARIERLSRLSNVKLKRTKKDEILNLSNHEAALNDQSVDGLKDQMDLNNSFILVVDDLEVLMLPPFKSDSISAIYSINKVLIFNFKRGIENKFSKK